MEVYIKCIKKPLGVDHVQIDTYPDSNKAIVVDDVTITHRKEDYSFLLELKLDLTDEDISELRDTEKFYQEGTLAYIIINKLDEAMKKVLSYIKYFSFVRELDENLHSQGLTQWSLDGQEWTDVPMKFEHKWVGGQFIYTLHKSFIDWIPELIKTGVVPFFGYFHLHKAFSETDTRHQWINATIAAELAIKEFLGTYKPDLLPILTHLPSPPLHKMYGELLNDLTGQKSPVVSSLNKGAQTRNDLVHKPNVIPPSKQQTNQYLLEVNLAIMHLHYLCSPQNEAMTFLFEKAKEDLKNANPE